MEKGRLLLPFASLEQIENMARREGIEPDLQSVWQEAHLAVQKKKPIKVPVQIETMKPPNDLLTDPLFQQTVADQEWTIANLPFGTLATNQLVINMDYVKKIQSNLKKDQDPIDLNLPCSTAIEDGFIDLKHYPTPTVYYATKELNLFISNVEIQPGNPLQITFSLQNIARYAAVHHIQDHYVLTNGTHRALALYLSGHNEIPCLLFENSTTHDLVGEIAPDFYERKKRPPLVQDFLDRDLTWELPLLPKQKIFIFRGDQTILPSV